MTFTKKRWQKLAGITVSEKNKTDTLSESFTNFGIASPGIMSNPFGESCEEKNTDVPELEEQVELDNSPESRWPSREDEEEWRAGHEVDEEGNFQERMPMGWEDEGFNAIVINDIGMGLQKIDRSIEGLNKAEMLATRLEKAIKALSDELRSEINADLEIEQEE